MKAIRGVGVHYQGDLRQEMMDAAAAVLADAGAEHVSLRDVARRGGGSHAAPPTISATRPARSPPMPCKDSSSSPNTSAQPPTVLAALSTRCRPTRAYVEFSDLYPGHFEIMFRPALLNLSDPGYQSAGDKAFQLLRGPGHRMPAARLAPRRRHHRADRFHLGAAPRPRPPAPPGIAHAPPAGYPHPRH